MELWMTLWHIVENGEKDSEKVRRNLIRHGADLSGGGGTEFEGEDGETGSRSERKEIKQKRRQRP
jgi:hypothetical protein